MEKNLQKTQSNNVLEKWERTCDDYMKKREIVANKEKIDEIPRKKHYRMRAHCNVLSDTPFPFPLNPDYVDWTYHFPDVFAQKYEVPDIEHKRSELFLNSKLKSKK